MADPQQNPHDESDHAEQAAIDSALTAAVPGSNTTSGSAGAIPDDITNARSLGEDEAEYLKRKAAASAVDGNAASHQGGIGAQGGQADFGAAGNLAGYDKSGL